VASELKQERDGAVLIATLHRPERMHAIGTQLLEELPRVWSEAAADPSLRALLITASGDRAFCTGMDLQEMVERGRHRPLGSNYDSQRVTPLNCDVWLPTIVAVNGVCTGAGLHFIADADMVVASSTASFLDTHVAVGQVAVTEPITLLERIGLGNALKMVVLGRAGRLDAAEALRISLVDEVVEPERLRDRAIELAHAAASGSPSAIEKSKRAIRGALELPRRDAMQRGWELLLEQRAHHPDAVEGPRAFVERREPNWTVQ
jgi:enoyl-CoA hydratase/carnithine racemase